jgi:hypothetical protein
VANGSDGVIAQLSTWCEEHPAFELAGTTSERSVLLRLGPRAHAEDIADEVYVGVLHHVEPPEGVIVEHVVTGGGPAIEITVAHGSVDIAALRSAVDRIGSESERLIELWHPHLPPDGA